MRIVPQSAAASYSLLLPAPRIAGLLPAVCDPPKCDPFVYASPYMRELPSDQRRQIFDAARILLDVAIDVRRELLTDHTLNTAIAVFRRAVTDTPYLARNPAEFAAELDAPILEYMVEMAHIRSKYADRGVDHA